MDGVHDVELLSQLLERRPELSISYEHDMHVREPLAENPEGPEQRFMVLYRSELCHHANQKSVLGKPKPANELFPLIDTERSKG